MNIEREMRFYFPLEELEFWKSVLKKFNHKGRYYEITIMYDNPNPALTFYSASIDGRLRLRMARQTDEKSKNGNYGLLSWKQRIPSLKDEVIRHENEIEFGFNPEEFSSVQLILEDILHCPKISSYERYRSHYEINDIKVTLDEFPFALMIELEIQGDFNKGEKQIMDLLSQLKLDASLSSAYSCDDMYRELCINANKKASQNILFNDPDMPHLR